MYLLYLDDSGSPSDKSQKFFVMAGICIFERQTHWLDSHLTPIAARFEPASPSSIELHANPMRSGSDGWKRFSAVDRVQATVDALHLLSSPQLRVKVFAAVIEKSEVADMKAVIATAFEAVAVKFDNYLASWSRIGFLEDTKRKMIADLN